MIYSDKQRELLRMWQHGKLKRFNLLEGSVRSGKTWVSLVLWAFWVASMPENGAYLMAAKTLTSLRRNVLDLLVSLVGEDHFTYSIPGKEAKLFGRQIYLEGVNDARAESKIRGMTLQGAYCDELTLFTEDFFSMLLSRLSEPGAKLFATTNPDTPRHWLMEHYIARSNDLDCLVMKFLIDDNPFLDRDYVDNLKKEYTGVFYDRYILGEWVVAEGLIYRQFADNPTRWLISREDAKKEQDNYLFITIGIDFGGNRSLTTFVATAIHKGYEGITVLKDHHIKGIKGEIDSDRVNSEFVQFVFDLARDYPDTYIRVGFGDNEAQYLINGLRRRVRAEGLTLEIADCMKVPVVQRIICTETMLNTDRLRIVKEDCPLLQAGLASAVWDEKAATKGKDVRLDNGSTDIDILDAFEYSFERMMKKFTPRKLETGR